MGLLTKLKSLLGLEDDRSQVRRGESGVTIERDPDESAEPNAETESAVEGVDADGEESIEADDSVTEREATATGTERERTDATGTEPERTDATGDATTTPEGIEEAEVDREDDEAVDSDVEAVDSGTEAVEPETETDEPESGIDETGTEVETDADETEADETEADETEEADETGAEPEPVDRDVAEESASTGEPLEDVKGIGPAYAERLRDAGVADVADLAVADADRLAEETDLSVKRVSGWIERAQAR